MCVLEPWSVPRGFALSYTITITVYEPLATNALPLVERCILKPLWANTEVNRVDIEPSTEEESTDDETSLYREIRNVLQEAHEAYLPDSEDSSDS